MTDDDDKAISGVGGPPQVASVHTMHTRIMVVSKKFVLSPYG